jgi:hypothetical protein
MSGYYPERCPCCGLWSHDVELRRMNTQYVDENSNYLTSCLPCFKESEEYWAERWNEYYAGCV